MYDDARQTWQCQAARVQIKKKDTAASEGIGIHGKILHTELAVMLMSTILKLHKDRTNSDLPKSTPRSIDRLEVLQPHCLNFF